MNKMKVFENERFGKIRGVMIDDEPWLVGKDVAAALGYSNASKALIDHVDDEDKLNNESLSSLGQRGGWLINESGLYSLILSSKLPDAKKFKRWVTSEVLPSIRKTGGYIAGQESLTDVELLAKAVLIAQKTIEELIGEIAKLFKQNRLFKWLREHGYLIRRKGTDYNMPTQIAMEKGLFRVKETAITHSDGHVSVNKTPKVTGEGQNFFINLFLVNG